MFFSLLDWSVFCSIHFLFLTQVGCFIKYNKIAVSSISGSLVTGVCVRCSLIVSFFFFHQDVEKILSLNNWYLICAYKICKKCRAFWNSVNPTFNRIDLDICWKQNYQPRGLVTAVSWSMWPVDFTSMSLLLLSNFCVTARSVLLMSHLIFNKLRHLWDIPKST